MGVDIVGLDILSPAVYVEDAIVSSEVVRDELIWWAEAGEYVIRSSTVFVWDGEGTSNLASEAANW